MPRRFKRSRRSRRRYGRAFSRRVRKIAYGIQEKKFYEYWFNAQQTLAYSAPSASLSNIPIGLDWMGGSLINTIQVGTANDQRIGHKIHVKYIQLNIFVAPDQTDANHIKNGMACRYMVLRDRNAAGQTMPRQITQSQLVPGIVAQHRDLIFGAFRHRDVLGRYKVLCDEQHLASYTSSTSTTGTRVVQKFIKVNRTFNFTSQAPGPVPDMKETSNMNQGDLLFIACANMVDCCSMRVGVRVCFTDA